MIISDEIIKKVNWYFFDKFKIKKRKIEIIRNYLLLFLALVFFAEDFFLLPPLAIFASQTYLVYPAFVLRIDFRCRQRSRDNQIFF